jgi:hypothetical protein
LRGSMIDEAFSSIYFPRSSSPFTMNLTSKLHRDNSDQAPIKTSTFVSLGRLLLVL